MLHALSAYSRGASRVRLGAVVTCLVLAAVSAGRSGAAVQRVVLDNGLTVLAKQDTSSDIAAVKLLIRVGQEHELPDRAGIRTLIGEMLLQSMRERLRDSAELEPLRQQQDAAAERVLFNTGTHWGYAELQATVSSDALPDCLRFLQSAAFEGELTREQLVQARDALNTTRAQSLELDPLRQTYLLLRKALAGHSSGAVSLLGTKESLADISLDDATDFWKRAYVASNAYIAIVSPVPPREAVAFVKQAFERSAAGMRLANAALLPADAGDVEVEGSSDLLRLARPRIPPPAALMVGVPIPPPGDPDAVVAQVIGAVLGRPGGTLAHDGKLAKVLDFPGASRLQPARTLVVPAGAVAPHMTIHAFCDAYKIDDTKAALLGCLSRLRTERITAADLEAAKAFAVNQSALRHETKAGQAEQLAKWELLGGGYDYDESFAARVTGVTPRDIQRVATRYFARPALALQLPVSP